ncbi:cupin-like domain-containing protein [Duganella sp. FT94W]|uniref:Cupin-like domain-containing protein n=1 Tax=Duganella lactea TaxID=2692173 RepID=A0ABW9VE83_9BURK|nr:cupin-like domain-containing protein [Duganella lactea]MYM36893.1 cupin-like domain-containing protein [Duganella lactea]
MSRTIKALPPRVLATETPEQAAANKQAREQRDAQIRGVSSIHEMREAIKQASRALPTIDAVPRVKALTAAQFRERAAPGLPFLIDGVVNRWPLAAQPQSLLRERHGDMPVRARVGDYINTAFAADRAMRDMSMAEYLDLAERTEGLPPYLGNLELKALNSMCHWPTYFDKMGPARFWIGPAGTLTPLHCDYDDNIFAQIWGSKRIFLAPPHHDAFLYVKEASAMLFGSPFNPEAPDYERYPLARQATLIEVLVRPGDMLYVPAGWYHQVHALTFSLSSNRWARGVPFVLREPS